MGATWVAISDRDAAVPLHTITLSSDRRSHEPARRWRMPQVRARSHRLRIGRFSKPGGVYLVTFTTFDRLPFFADFGDARTASRTLAAPSSWPHARLLAWVLMPDHWHGLIELGERESCRAGLHVRKPKRAENGGERTGTTIYGRPAFTITRCAARKRCFNAHATSCSIPCGLASSGDARITRSGMQSGYHEFEPPTAPM